MNELIAVTKAAVRAAHWHATQRRKGAAQEPYVNHLLEVAELVAEATKGEDLNLVLAALLHDTVEDQGVSRAEIADEFGEEVASLVLEVTDDKTLPKAERKALQVDHAPHKSARASILKMADKTSNLRALASSPPADWSIQRKAEYVQWARAVVAGLPATNVWLGERFEEAANAAGRAAVEAA